MCTLCLKGAKPLRKKRSNSDQWQRRLRGAHGLPKTHKAYANSSSFRPIIDTTSIPYHNIGKFLSFLLQPLTHNDYNLKDSFDTVNRIRSIPPKLSNHCLPMAQLRKQSTTF